MTATMITIIVSLIGILVSLIIFRQKTIRITEDKFMNEIGDIDARLNTVLPCTISPLEVMAYSNSCKLSSVNFIKFKKTCSRKQRRELDVAYNNYKNDKKYESFINLKLLVENIINNRSL